MIVVSDTSSILNLAVISQLELLRRLYSEVVIPPAVRQELVQDAAMPGAAEVEAAEWITVTEVENLALVTALRTQLDDGEAEAIALAVELRASLLLLDERKARAVASRFGLNFTGLLGVLMEAKQKGCVTAVQPILDALMYKAGFWIGSELYERVLVEAGE